MARASDTLATIASLFIAAALVALSIAFFAGTFWATATLIAAEMFGDAIVLFQAETWLNLTFVAFTLVAWVVAIATLGSLLLAVAAAIVGVEGTVRRIRTRWRVYRADRRLFQNE